LKQFFDLYKDWVNKNNFSKNTLKINDKAYSDIINWLYKKLSVNKNYDYKIFLFDLLDKEEFQKIIISVIQKFIDNYIHINNESISKLFHLISKHYDKLILKDSNFLIKYIEKIDLDEIDYINIWEIVDYIDNKNEVDEYNQDLLDLLEVKILEYLEKEKEYIINDIDFNDYLNDWDNPMDLDLDFIIDDIKSNILPDKLSDLISLYWIYQPISNIKNYNLSISNNYLDKKYEEYKNSLNFDEDAEYERYKEMKEEKESSNEFNELDYIFIKK
jgi:hypothetical protein